MTVVVVGAGPAGAAAAATLAAAGRPPLLLERTLQPAPRICGEFVSAEAAALLSRLGLGVAALGARPVRRLRLLHGRDCIEAELPFIAWGLRRRTLDAALQDRAAAAGTDLRRGCRATLLPAPPGAFRLGLGDGTEPITASTLLLACGKTDLAPLQRPPQPATTRLVGLQCHLRLAPAQLAALDGHIELLLFDGGYAGLQTVDGGLANVCLLADADLARAGLPSLLQRLAERSPLLAERLDGALPDGAVRTIARVPYGHLHRASARDAPGLWRLGDQAAVIPSFTGDGLAIALCSAALATRTLLDGGSAADYHRRLHAALRWQIARAQLLYRAGRPAIGRRALLPLLRRWPQLMAFAAAMTRVPAPAWAGV